jgi:Cu2+-exporting ATPase/Cu+-exporting ATPase
LISDLDACCAQCGLPLAGRGVRATIDGQTRSFCCYGCSLVLQITRQPGEAGSAHALLIRLGLSAFFAMNAMMFSLPAYFPFFYPTASADLGESGFLLVLRVLSLLLSLPVFFLLGVPILIQSLRQARQAACTVDALIAIGAFAGLGLSIWNTLRNSPHVYADTAAMLLVLVALGRYLEASAKLKTAEGLHTVLDQIPQKALRIQDGSSEEVLTSELLPGDQIRVLPGSGIPVDGQVIQGESSVDESSLTGESRPVFKATGSRVAASTIALDGHLVVETERAVAESTAARIARLLQEARLARGPSERLADRLAASFLPMVLLLSLGVFAFWCLHSGVETAWMACLSVLVVSCPCAFGIATPAATWTALGRAARHGILVKNGATLETLGAVQQAFFDKTGTLTTGTPSFTGAVVHPECPLPEPEILQRVAVLQSLVPHPIAQAFILAVGEPKSDQTVADFRYHPGLGLEGRVGEAGQPHLVVGSARLMARAGLQLDGTLQQLVNGEGPTGATVVFVGWDGRVQAALFFRETVRPEAGSTLEGLQSLGVRVSILTGDRAVPAPTLGYLPASVQVKAGLMPEDKVRILRTARTAERSVAMVGDGINDAPALAAADVGIAVGTGADLTREAADVNVLSPDLGKVLWIIQYARKLRRTVRGNLFWAFAYNGVAIAFAAAGRLNPLVAAAAMIASSLFILWNTRRLALA